MCRAGGGSRKKTSGTASSTAPEDKAAAFRSSTQRTPSYSELAFGPVSLDSGKAFRWEFRSGEYQSVVYFLNKCAPDQFAALEQGFEEVAASVTPSCGHPGP